MTMKVEPRYFYDATFRLFLHKWKKNIPSILSYVFIVKSFLVDVIKLVLFQALSRSRTSQILE